NWTGQNTQGDQPVDRSQQGGEKLPTVIKEDEASRNAGSDKNPIGEWRHGRLTRQTHADFTQQSRHNNESDKPPERLDGDGAVAQEGKY
ncbi:MAG: hypothetical protein K2X93_13565, partial [Candidatus Obscuribacterales bacterium]|nr:hypothetical protein [Candidatus Obscuribacterales bacterium]